MKDLLSLFFAYAKTGIKSRFQYGFDAVFAALAVFVREASIIIAVYFLLLKFDTINNWNFREILFLFSIIAVTYGLFVMFFMAFRDFSDWIKHGDFDRVLLRPRGLFTQLLLCGADWVAALAHGALGIILFIISANSVGIVWDFGTVIYYIVTIVSGVIIQGAVFVLFSSFSFYFLQTQSIKEVFFWNARKFASFPLSIYNGIIQMILMFIIPFAFVNYFPAQFFLRKADMAAYPQWCMYISPIVAVVLFVVAYAFWRFSLRYYKSTGN